MKRKIIFLYSTTEKISFQEKNVKKLKKEDIILNKIEQEDRLQRTIIGIHGEIAAFYLWGYQVISFPVLAFSCTGGPKSA